LEALLIGLHRAVEAEEVGVAPECLGEDAIALGVAFAAQALALARGFRLDDRGLAVAVGAEFCRLALALGAHAVEDVLGILLRQVGALDAHIYHLEPELLALLVDL